MKFKGLRAGSRGAGSIGVKEVANFCRKKAASVTGKKGMGNDWTGSVKKEGPDLTVN